MVVSKRFTSLVCCITMLLATQSRASLNSEGEILPDYFAVLSARAICSMLMNFRKLSHKFVTVSNYDDSESEGRGICEWSGRKLEAFTGAAYGVQQKTHTTVKKSSGKAEGISVPHPSQCHQYKEHYHPPKNSLPTTPCLLSL